MARKNTGVVIVYLILFLYLGLNICGAMYPSISNWGFNRWSVVPVSVTILSSTLVLMLSLALASATGSKLFRSASRWRHRHEGKQVRICYIILAVGFLLTLYLLRSRALDYGDGFSVFYHITGNPDQLIFDQYRLQIGSILFKRVIYLATSIYTDVDASTFFSVFNLAGGLIGFYSIFLLSGFQEQNKPRWLFLIGILSSGATLLFLGHVEQYTWSTSIGLLSLYFSMRMARGESLGWLAIVFGGIAVFLHVIAIPFLAVAILVSVWSRYAERDPDFKLTARFVSIGALFLSITVVMVFRTHRSLNVFVPLFSQPENSYTATSWPHIRDTLNLVVFLAPLSIWFLVTFLLQRKALRAGTLESRILGCVALLTFLPSFWIDPTLGMVRDWDLFAQFGIPVSLYILFKHNTFIGGDFTFHRVTPLILVSFVSLFPNLYENLDLQRSSVYLDKMLWKDPHYQAHYSNAQRCLSWGSILKKNVGRADLAEKYFVRRTQANPAEFSAWNTLGELALDRKDYDSAANCFERSLSNNPSQADVHLRLTQALGWAGKWQKALTVAKATMKLIPTEPKAKYNLGLLLFQLKKYPEAITTLQNITDTATRRTTEFDACLGTAFLMTQKWDSAYAYLSRFVAKHPERSVIRESLLKTEIALRKEREALQTLVVLKSQGYSSDILSKYEKLLLRNSDSQMK